MKDLFGAIAALFAWIHKALTITRNLVLNLLFLAILFILAASFLLKDRETIQTDRSIVVLSLAGDIVEEKKITGPFVEALNQVLGEEEIPQETLLQDALDVINHAADDPKVQYLLLDLEHLGDIGLDQMQLIGQALANFRLSKKKVIAAEDTFLQNGYYLASHADEIYLNPMGGIDLHGFADYRLFFKEALDKLRVNYHIFRVGAYKSAVEPIMRDSMSEEAKSQSQQWLSALWHAYTEDVTKERKLAPDSIDRYANTLASELALRGGNLAQLALELKLVDGLKSREELRLYLENLPPAKGSTKAGRIAFRDYLRTFTPSYHGAPDPVNNVGIIIAEGPILGGVQQPGLIGADSLTASLRKAREDEKIKAVVLRIRSGGGSVMASELIRQELLELKKSKKPLVVSMGSVAASGGYWIAADADEIWAAPTTLTGSIGIFAAIPTFENSLAGLGIHSDGQGTTELASGLDITRPLSPGFKESTQLVLDHGYRQFLEIVAKGRELRTSEVEELAQGKVFAGKKALELGLVDKLGTLQDAVVSAAHLAGLQNYSVISIEKPQTLRDELSHLLEGDKERDGQGFLSLSPSLPPLFRRLFDQARPLGEFLILNDPAGLYAWSMVGDYSPSKH